MKTQLNLETIAPAKNLGANLKLAKSAKRDEFYTQRVDVERRHEKLYLTAKLSAGDYPNYDNQPTIINVDKVSGIPSDYDGVMGVPITFIYKHNPEQFEIIGLDRYSDLNNTPGERFSVDGREKFARVLIQRIKSTQVVPKEKPLHGSTGAIPLNHLTCREQYKYLCCARTRQERLYTKTVKSNTSRYPLSFFAAAFMQWGSPALSI